MPQNPASSVEEEIKTTTRKGFEEERIDLDEAMESLHKPSINNNNRPTITDSVGERIEGENNNNKQERPNVMGPVGSGQSSHHHQRQATADTTRPGAEFVAGPGFQRERSSSDEEGNNNMRLADAEGGEYLISATAVDETDYVEGEPVAPFEVKLRQRKKLLILMGCLLLAAVLTAVGVGIGLGTRQSPAREAVTFPPGSSIGNGAVVAAPSPQETQPPSGPPTPQPTAYSWGNNALTLQGGQKGGYDGYDFFGNMVSLSSDGTRLLAAAKYKLNYTGTNRYHVLELPYSYVQVYEIQSDGRTAEPLVKDDVQDQISNIAWAEIYRNGQGFSVITVQEKLVRNRTTPFYSLRSYDVEGKETRPPLPLGNEKNDGDGTMFVNDCVAAISNDGSSFAFPQESFVRVFQYNGSSWELLGREIYPNKENTSWGAYDVDLSENGLTVAFSFSNSWRNEEGGTVILDFHSNEWVQRGSMLPRSKKISLSSDGSHIALARRGVAVFSFNGDDWMHTGQELYEAHNSLYLDRAYLSGDGNTVVTSYSNDESIETVEMASFSLVRVFRYHEEERKWKQVGETLRGQSVSEGFGLRVSVSFKGNRIAVGSPHVVGFQNFGGLVQLRRGLVQVYTIDAGPQYQAESTLSPADSGTRVDRIPVDDSLVLIDVTLDRQGINSGPFAIDSKGRVIIPYVHNSPFFATGHLKLLRCVSSTCEGENVISFLTDYPARDPSLAVNSLGHATLMFVTEDDRIGLIVCKDFNCDTRRTVFPFSEPKYDPGYGRASSIAVNSNDYPVAVAKDSVANRLMIIGCKDRVCDNFGVTEISTSAELLHSVPLRLSSKGYPVVGVYDRNNVTYDYFLQLVSCGSSNCSEYGMFTAPLNSSSSNIGSASFILDAADRPVLSFVDNSVIKVLRCGNPSCSEGNSISTVASYDYWDIETSIQLSKEGFPVISYAVRHSAVADLHLARCTSANCASGKNRVTTLLRDIPENFDFDMVTNSHGDPVISVAYYEKSISLLIPLNTSEE